MRLRIITENLINVFLVIVEGFLGLRFLLKLFGANDTGFVSWIYEMSGALLDPFRGVFPVRVFENDFVFEFSTLFAMIMYALLGMVLLAVVGFLVSLGEGPVSKKRR